MARTIEDHILDALLDRCGFDEIEELTSVFGGQIELNLSMVRSMQVPLPPNKTQCEIVAELEAEQQLINANKKLIEIYQQKIKSKIAEVWRE